MARADRWAGEGEAEEMERAIAWLRRVLKISTPPEERRERARRRRERNRPPQPEPEPVVEERRLVGSAAGAGTPRLLESTLLLGIMTTRGGLLAPSSLGR